MAQQPKAATPEPVEYFNAVFPNQVLVQREAKPLGPDYDPALERRVEFLAGYFRATEPWQIDLIERELVRRGIAHRANSPEQRCPKCGWISKATQAFQYHIDQHA